MLDARTGALLWSHVIGSGPYGGPGFSTPAVGSGGPVCVNVSISAEQQVYTDLFCMGEGVETSFNASASAPAVAHGMVYEGVSAYSYQEGISLPPCTPWVFGSTCRSAIASVRKQSLMG